MKPRRIFYVTNARLPTEKAHGLASIKLAEALAKQGIEVTVFHPRRIHPARTNSHGAGPLDADPYRTYAVERNFAIRTLPCLDFLWLGFGERIFFPLQLFSYSIVVALYLFLRYGITGELGDTVIFSHDHIPLWFISFFAPNIFLDVHDYPTQNLFFRRVLRRAIGVAVQTKWKQRQLAKDFGILESKIIYWPNGTDIRRFDAPVSRTDARRALNLPLDQRLVVYTGSLQTWKGVDTLVGAAKFLPDDAAVYIVGGDEASIRSFETENSKLLTHKLTFAGQKPWQEIPLWLASADVLVLPNTGREEISLHYTSPMKLFEYMASGRPIVASNIPSIREIVDETMVGFASPDDPASFADAIKKVIANPARAREHSERARREVEKYTWEARARKILERM